MSEHNITVEGGTSVRLLTAGKYCDRDILVTAEGGGIALDVVTASTLPATVTDGQIVIITATAPGTVYIDTDEPANPESGDVWVTMAAEATVKLELTEETPHLRGGLTAAAQWDGSAWVSRDGYLGVDGAWVQIALSLPAIGTALNDCTWEQIEKIAASGRATDYFVTGDAKEIVINGTVGNTTFSQLSVWAFIIGFDHNADIEGSNTIHFQICKSAQADGTNLALIDSKYATSVADTAGYFNINYTDENSDGWASSKMRTVLLGNSNKPSNPLTGSLMAALPSELRNVMKGVTKYSDNTGDGSNTADCVTATTDYLWLLAEWEVYGVRKYANNAEQKYQQQYEYYASGNSPLFYRHTSASNTAVYWLRSVRATTATEFCAVNSSAAVTSYEATYSRGLAPCFCV